MAKDCKKELKQMEDRVAALEAQVAGLIKIHNRAKAKSMLTRLRDRYQEEYMEKALGEALDPNR